MLLVAVQNDITYVYNILDVPILQNTESRFFFQTAHEFIHNAVTIIIIISQRMQ